MVSLFWESGGGGPHLSLEYLDCYRIRVIDPSAFENPRRVVHFGAHRYALVPGETGAALEPDPDFPGKLRLAIDPQGLDGFGPGVRIRGLTISDLYGFALLQPGRSFRNTSDEASGACLDACSIYWDQEATETRLSELREQRLWQEHLRDCSRSAMAELRAEAIKLDVEERQRRRREQNNRKRERRPYQERLVAEISAERARSAADADQSLADQGFLNPQIDEKWMASRRSARRRARKPTFQETWRPGPQLEA